MPIRCLSVGLICLFLFGCQDFLPKQGEVARVNGRPIFLKSVQHFYDSASVGLTGESEVSAEDLRIGYAKAVSELIVIELVNAELEKRGLAITEEEVVAESARLLVDYPPSEFERQTLEDSLDMDSWRMQIKGRLAIQRFRQRVLQPRISVTPQEFREYYQANSNKLPAQLHFRILQAEDPKILEKAAKTSLGADLSENFQAVFPGVFMREGRLAKDRIDPRIMKGLAGLKPQQAGPVVKDDEGGYICYVLVNNIEEHEIDFADSFKLNEEAILEDKLEYAFKTWLNTARRKANISVSTYLLHPQQDSDVPLNKAALGLSRQDRASSKLPTLPPPGGNHLDIGAKATSIEPHVKRSVQKGHKDSPSVN